LNANHDLGGEQNADLAAHFSSLEDLIGYKFDSHVLLARAFTHTSVRAAPKDDVSHYERLEFLGDRVLGLVVAEMLWRKFPNAAEGELSLRLNALVNGATCAEIADEIGLHHYIRTGADVGKITGKRMTSVRADVLEALMAAMYLDGGLEPLTEFVSRFWDKRITEKQAARRDPKTALQEWAHARHLGTPSYDVLSRTGPDHDPEFVVRVKMTKAEGEEGRGRSKRAAEQSAAEATLIAHEVWKPE
jgi:ribonuclease-3